MGQVLGIVYRVIATHLVKKAGHTHVTARTGAVTLIQCFGSALNLNIHFHMLFLDGVYVDSPDGAARFRWVKAPTSAEITQLAHAIAHRADERKKLERLCGYISRPAVSEKRPSLTPNGSVRYQLKTPYKDGTTHVIFEPLDFITRLVTLVPKPRVNLTRFHGVFAPNSKYRALITPAKRGKGNKAKVSDEPQTPVEHRAARACPASVASALGMTWAQRLKRVFNIDIEVCNECGGSVKVIACIEAPVVIKKIFDHLKEMGACQDAVRLPESRGPPQTSLFDEGKPVREAQGCCRRHRARVALGRRFRLDGSQSRNPVDFAD